MEARDGRCFSYGSFNCFNSTAVRDSTGVRDGRTVHGRQWRANHTTTTKMAQSWHKYHAADFMESELSMQAVAKDMKSFREATEKVVGDHAQVMVVIENRDRECDWVVILLPHCNRQVKAVHSCFTTENQVWWIHGNMGTSAVLLVPLDRIEGIYLDDTEPPTVDQYKSCKMAGDFKKLTGSKCDEKKRRSETNPNLYLVGLSLYVKFFELGELTAEALAEGIIIESSKDKNPINEDLRGLLNFLWYVSQGMCQAFTLTYSDKRPKEVDMIAGRLLGDLYGHRPSASKQGTQKEELAEQRSEEPDLEQQEETGDNDELERDRRQQVEKRRGSSASPRPLSGPNDQHRRGPGKRSTSKPQKQA